jgi:murein endopeptidase
MVRAALALGAVAAVLAGCGGASGIGHVRVLQMNPAGLVTKQSHGSRIVQAALIGSGGSSVAPTQVPAVGSLALGSPDGGRLVNGLQLPGAGPDWVTYDPALRTLPSGSDRRWATDRLLAFLLYVLRAYRLANPGAPPVVIGDLSRPYGGPFAGADGALGHASHQNGLDADVYYPRLDRRLQPPEDVAQVDRSLAQDLVDRFVAAGAQFAFVGEHVGLRGPSQVVQPIANHDEHVHVRIVNARR